MKKINIALLCMALFSGILSTASSKDTTSNNNPKWALNIDVINKTNKNSVILFSAITTWITKQVKDGISTESKHGATTISALKSKSNATTLHKASFFNTGDAQLTYQLQLKKNGAKSQEFTIEKNCTLLEIELNADGTVKCTRVVEKPIAKL
jgi:hypothetical protein